MNRKASKARGSGRVGREVTEGGGGGGTTHGGEEEEGTGRKVGEKVGWSAGKGERGAIREGEGGTGGGGEKRTEHEKVILGTVNQ